MVKISIYVAAAVTTPNFIQKTGTTYEIDTTGTFVSPGIKVGNFYVFGTDTQDISNAFSNAQAAVRNKSNGTQSAFYFTATRLFGTNDVQVGINATIKELKV